MHAHARQGVADAPFSFSTDESVTVSGFAGWFDADFAGSEVRVRVRVRVRARARAGARVRVRVRVLVCVCVCMCVRVHVTRPIHQCFPTPNPLPLPPTPYSLRATGESMHRDCGPVHSPGRRLHALGATGFLPRKSNRA